MSTIDNASTNRFRRNGLLLVSFGAVLALLAGVGVWWTLFRVDPEHTQAVRATEQKQESIDQALGLNGDEDDFASLKEERSQTETESEK